MTGEITDEMIAHVRLASVIEAINEFGVEAFAPSDIRDLRAALAARPTEAGSVEPVAWRMRDPHDRWMFSPYRPSVGAAEPLYSAAAIAERDERIERLEELNAKLCNDFNSLLVCNSRLQDRAALQQEGENDAE